MKQITYTTVGSVRGCCGHNHRSAAAAGLCVGRDQRACESQGGYSDRQVRRSDGRDLEDWEHDAELQARNPY